MIKKNIFKKFYIVVCASLICLNTPANAMMGQLRSTVARAAQAVRQSAAVYRSSLFAKPQTGTFHPLAQASVPLNAQLPALTPATQQKTNPKSLAPCIAAAGVVAASNGEGKEADTPVIETPETETQKLTNKLALMPQKDHAAALVNYIGEVIKTTDFIKLYNTVRECSKNLDTEEVNGLFKTLLEQWKRHKLGFYNNSELCAQVTDIILKGRSGDGYAYAAAFMKKFCEPYVNPRSEYFTFLQHFSSQERVTLLTTLLNQIREQYTITKVFELFFATLTFFTDTELLRVVESFMDGYYGDLFIESLKKETPPPPHCARILAVVLKQGSGDLQLKFLSEGGPDLFLQDQTLWTEKTCKLFTDYLQTVSLTKESLPTVSKLFKQLTKNSLSSGLLTYAQDNSVDLLLLYLFFEPAELSSEQKNKILTKHSDALIALGECIAPLYLSPEYEQWDTDFLEQVGMKLIQSNSTELTGFTHAVFRALACERKNYDFSFFKNRSPQEKLLLISKLLQHEPTDNGGYTLLFDALPTLCTQDIVRLISQHIKAEQKNLHQLCYQLKQQTKKGDYLSACKILQSLPQQEFPELHLTVLSRVGPQIFSSNQEDQWATAVFDLFVKCLKTPYTTSLTVKLLGGLFDEIIHAKRPTEKLLLLTSQHNNLELLIFFLLYKPEALSTEQQNALFTKHSDKIIAMGQALSSPRGYQYTFCRKLPYELLQNLLQKILEKRPTQLNEFIKILLNNLKTDAERTHWQKSLYLAQHNPFEVEDTQQGPLFQNNFTEEQLKEPLANDRAANFIGLLPLITEYVNEQYRNKRIVLFHGQSHHWLFLQAVYEQLRAYKDNTNPDEKPVYVRLSKHSTLSEKEVQTLREKGIQGNNDIYRSQGLFANLHPFSNHYGDKGSSSWEYVTRNFDQISNRNDLDVDKSVKDLFTNLDMGKQYEMLITQNPSVFKDLHALFTESVEGQGYFGNLLVISMPPDTAEKLVYSARMGGWQHSITINGHETTSVVEASQNPEQVSIDTEWVIALSEEMVNPEKRKEAGIEIVGFDPVKYWQTDSYLKFEEQLQKELMEPLRNTGAQKA